MKPLWELAVRRRIGLPRHNTANDGAVVLLYTIALLLGVAVVTACAAPWFAGRAAVFTASAYTGLALQQYAWYTGRIYAECWGEEGVAVVAIAMLMSILIGVVSMLFSILMGSMLRLIVLGGLHAALLFAWRWVGLVGSLFDGTEKLRRRQGEVISGGGQGYKGY